MAKYLLLSLTLFLTACTTSQPIPTATSLPPTLSSQPIEVKFTGDDCTVTGPTELPAGKHTFTFIDESGMDAELWLLSLRDGKTTQDILDRQSEPGDWYPKPGWVSYDTRLSIESKESDGRRVDSYIWNLLKVGEHTISCYVPSPQMMWFPAPLMIVEATSE
jgi:hypothetical protein